MTEASDVVRLPLLPTGKSHISFSELSTWLECPYRHKLSYVDGLSKFDGNEHTFFGTHVHHGCESFMNTRVMPVEEVLDLISDTWTTRGFADKDKWVEQARCILNEVPSWMDATFEAWEPIAAEHALYEGLDHLGHPDVRWKGFVDAAIKHVHPSKKGKTIVRIIDWKTTAWGWSVSKQREFKTNAQAAVYKIFWSRKFNVDMSDIRANFVLLKRDAKPGRRCQLIEVSVGPKMEMKVNESIDKMLRAVKVRHWPKNKGSCRFCEFNATPACEGDGGRD